VTLANLDQIATIAGAILTVMVFSYLLGDNFLYRLAISVLIGASAGFLLIVAVESVLIPWFLTTMSNPLQAPGTFAIGLIPILISFLLVLKTTTGSLSRIGSAGIAVMIGVGTGIAVWGAISGTLFPLVGDTARGMQSGNFIDGVIVLIGTITVLMSFTYLGTQRANGQTVQIFFARLSGGIGRIFIAITLGATYALLIISALTVLTSVISSRIMVLKP
jgi:hypothetical protein